MIASFPEKLSFDMAIAARMINDENEATQEAETKTGQGKTKQRHLLGDTRRDRPEIKRQLEIFADRPKPVMSTKKVMPVRKNQFNQVRR